MATSTDGTDVFALIASASLCSIIWISEFGVCLIVLPGLWSALNVEGVLRKMIGFLKRGRIERRMNDTMTDQDLLNRGFKQFPPTYPIDHDGIETKFQKRYDDDIGKRYFININKWKPIEDRNAPGGVWPANYEYEVYFQNDDSEKRGAIKILLYAGWDIDEVEEYVQKLFETGLFEYYEKWEDC